MDQKGNNVINNYKGVMLCSRPNQNNQIAVEKPFCGRVYNHEQIGLVPIKRQGSPPPQVKKQVPSILNKHKKWLQEFKEKQNKAKQQIEEKEKLQEQKFKKIKELGQIDRQRAKKMKNQYNQAATQVLNILDQSPVASRPGELNAANLKKLNDRNDELERDKKQDRAQRKNQQLMKKIKSIKKPQWAMTQQQKQKRQQEEVDELLDFFDNTEINQFSEDEQVKSILHNLKQKIEQIKKKDDWRERQEQRIREREQRKKEREERRKENDEDDKVTNFSGASQARSVASQRAQKNIQDLKRKKQEAQQEWDKHTVTSKHSYANIDERIAKNLADQVLRNYPHLRGVHSNTSIRKLLQAEAAKAISEPIPRPIITTIIKQPKPLDTNNLPYLHRNPAI